MAEVLGVAASIGSIVHISRKIIEVMNDVKDASAERVKLRDEIFNAIILIQALGYRVDQAGRGGPQLPTVAALVSRGGHLDELKKLLNTISEKIADNDRLRNFKNALAWPLQKKDTHEMLAEVQRHNSYFMLALQNDAIGLSLAMTGAVEKLDHDFRAARLETDQIRESRDVKRWLSASDPSTQFHSACKDRQAGTGQWFTEGNDFAEWLTTPGLFYWLNGIHLSIKEYLTSNIIRTGRAAQLPTRAEAYGMIAEMYLIYMLNVLDFEGSVDNAQFNKQFPLMTYASSWWCYCALRAGTANDGVNKAAIAFLQSRDVLRNFTEYRGYQTATPLYLACEAGLTVVAQKVLEKGADIHDIAHILVLAAAVRSGSPSLIEMLLQNGAAKDPKKAEKALVQALMLEDLESAKALISYGVDVNGPRTKTRGHGLLFWAIGISQGIKTDLVNFLLDHGARPDKRRGGMEITQAVESGMLETAKLLFSRGFEVSADVLSDAPLDNLALVQWLIDHGADVNVVFDYREGYGISVLRRAVACGRHAVADILREHGAVLDMNLRYEPPGSLFED